MIKLYGFTTVLKDQKEITMKTIKSHTDLEQSRKLAEFLPNESADQTWQRIAIAGANLNVQDKSQYKHNGDVPFIYFSDTGVPCWSLAALLDVLPKNYSRYTKSLYWFDDAWHLEYIGEDGESCYKGETANNPIDACYEMIIKLNELKIL